MRQFLCLLLCFCSFLVQAQSYKKEFTEANILYDDGMYALAIRMYGRILRDDPDNANIHYKIGKAYLEMGVDKSDALDHLKQAVKGIDKSYDPFNPYITSAPIDALYYMAHAYHLSYALDSAQKYFERFLGESSKKHYLRPNAERGLDMLSNARELMEHPLNVRIVNIDGPINTAYSEYSPIISADENVLFFTSRRKRTDETNLRAIDAATGLYYEDIYVTYKDPAGNWLDPVLLNINAADRHTSAVSMSTNGESLYVYQSEEENGNIYQSAFEIGQGWTTPVLIGSDVNSEDNEYYASITYDEQVLYFTSDREGGFGGKDIYFTRKLPNGTWAKSQNLGAPINTEFDEDLPYFHPDDKTMYFASNGHKSMGGYDVFYSQIGRDGKWGEPVNLGYPINTTDDDHSYIATLDGKRGYYASKSHDTKGMSDIFFIEYLEDERAKPELDLSAFAVVKGWILTDDQVIPDNFRVVLSDGKSGAFIAVAKPVIRNGSFVFIVPSDASYRIDYQLDSVSLFDETINIKAGTDYQELKREIFLFQRRGAFEVVALDDVVLGDVVRWKLAMNEAEGLVPIRSKVYYMTETGTVMDSSYVSKDGYFEYKPSPDGKPYILKPMLQGIEAKDLQIDLIDDRQQVEKIEMIHRDDLFVEVVRSAAIAESRALDRTTPSIVGVDEGQALPVSFKIIMDYNAVTSNDFEKYAGQIVARVKENIATSGTCSLRLSSSASTVPTSLEGGNERLSQRRLENGKKMLFELLEGASVDINKISTVSEESIVSGPDYLKNRGLSKSVFIEYQYFKIDFN